MADGDTTDTTGDCCAPTIALVQQLGRDGTCPVCEGHYLAVRGEAELPTPDPTPLHATDGTLAGLLDALRLARSYRHTQGDAAAGGPAPLRNPLARLISNAGPRPAEVDATERQVAGLWQQVTAPHGRVGERVRAGFVDALLEHCARDLPAEVDDTDLRAARAASERLDRAMATEDVLARKALGLLVSDAPSGWDGCCERLAELAPPEQRRAWDAPARLHGTAGRPRVDRAEVPVEVQRIAWGERVLVRVLGVWAAAVVKR